MMKNVMIMDGNRARGGKLAERTPIYGMDMPEIYMNRAGRAPEKAFLEKKLAGFQKERE